MKKNPFKSKTNQGIIILVVAYFLESLVGLTVGEEAIQSLVDNGIEAYNNIVVLFAGAYALYGRYVAKDPIGFGK